MKIQQYKIRLVEDGVVDYSLDKIISSDDAHLIFIQDFQGLPHEEVMAIWVGGSNNILGKSLLAMGGVHGCALTPRDIFRGAILVNASGIILGHNHPSGDPTPSTEDIHFTREIIKAGKMIGIDLLDHLVMAGKEYRSCFSYIKDI